MWSTTFQRFAPGRMPVIGSIAVAVSDWSRPRPGESQMFDQRLMERLTLAHPGWPVVIHGLAGVAAVAVALEAGIAVTAVGGAYLAGVFAWTLVEYLMHRFSFHHAPSTERQVAVGYLVHGVHHAFPDDSRRWVMPLVVTPWAPAGLADHNSAQNTARATVFITYSW